MEEEASAKEKSFAWAQAEGAQKSESRGNYGRVGVAKSAGLTVRLKGKRNSHSLSLFHSLFFRKARRGWRKVEKDCVSCLFKEV